MASAQPELLTDLLRATSRSFYLTMRVLPGAIRPQIGLAYLLARTTDTIADTEIVPLEQRLSLLQRLRERILGADSEALNFGELASKQVSAAEKLLLEKLEDSLTVLRGFSQQDQKLIQKVLDTITSGQELDLRRFARLNWKELSGAAQRIIALQSDTELDDYTYRVAGCVGEFWTKMCRAHVFPGAKLDDAFLLTNGMRFGKGLQLVNILRDLPADLHRGRCYLPTEKLREIGLTPEMLLEPANESKLRPLYNSYLDLAEAHLSAGWNYTNALPWRSARVRLACAWPILIGARTIDSLRLGNVLNSQRPVKIPRSEVRGIMLRSVLYYPAAAQWRKLL